MFYSAFGSTTSIGIDTAMAWSSIRAGISGYKESRHLCADNKFALTAHVNDDFFLSLALMTDFTGPYTATMDRSSKLMLYALDDLLRQKSIESPLPLIWLQNEPHPKREILPIEFIKDQFALFEAPIDLEKISPIAMGRASGIAALDRAFQLLHQANNDYVLIGGAECPFHEPWLEFLDANDRLKKQDGQDTFAPGEGAAFLLLSRDSQNAKKIQEGTLERCVELFRPGLSESPSHWYNDNPNNAEALQQAMALAIDYFERYSGISNAQIDQIVSSMNGENFWAKEYGVAQSRLREKCNTGEAKLHHPFEFSGDLGAISGIFLIAFAADIILRKRSKQSLVYASADNAWRSAVCLNARTRDC